jgi:hypothetical protein
MILKIVTKKYGNGHDQDHGNRRWTTGNGRKRARTVDLFWSRHVFR